ncbi:MAG: S41 family peptidase [Acidobacteriota bacterium]
MRLSFRFPGVPPALVLSLLCLASSPLPAEVPEALDSWLQFEAGANGKLPVGWTGGPPETLFYDSETVRSGEGAAGIVRQDKSSGQFSALTRSLDVEFSGETIELRGYLKTEGVVDAAGLWMRLNDRTGPVQFTNMQDRGPSGDTPWQEYSIELALDPKAETMSFGVLMGGAGTVWADDLRLLVDGKPIAEAPVRVREKTVLDLDAEFAAGSKIDMVEAPSEFQVETLALTARVWGFLKYHHPRITGGELHWDFELFRALPALLAAENAGDRDRLLLEWLRRVGAAEPCEACVEAAKEPYFDVRLGWMDGLSDELRSGLMEVHTRRAAGADRFYVSATPNVGNPDFSRELDYPDLADLDAGYRLLGFFRLWNIIEYFFPYRDLIDEDWGAVLGDSIPPVLAAESKDAYQLAMLRIIARIDDGHSNLWSANSLRPPVGECRLPVVLRFIEDKAVVVQLADGVEAATSALKVGDAILSVDGEAVSSLVESWLPLYPGSNRVHQRHGIARNLPRGACGATELTVDRGGEVKTLKAERLAEVPSTRYAHDRPGDGFQRLSEEVAYLKLSDVKMGDVDSYLEGAAGSRGLVIDIRNYPSNFMVFALGQRLVEEKTDFVSFTLADYANPGAFVWGITLALEPAEPGYRGQVVVLVDEASISQSEYTAMAFRASPRATVVGSTTAGADGNVSRIPLPGGLRTGISGIGIFYPDKSPTQRVGILPDIVATPTLEGMRQGRDEVLEVAIRHILGPEAPEDDIRRLAMRPVASAPSAP